MPDPLSTIFISSSQIGSDARESSWSVNLSIIITLGGIQMDPLWRTALWQQFGAAIDMLENALLACPSTLGTAPLARPLRPPSATGIRRILVHHLSYTLLARLISNRLT